MSNKLLWSAKEVHVVHVSISVHVLNAFPSSDILSHELDQEDILEMGGLKPVQPVFLYC